MKNYILTAAIIAVSTSASAWTRVDMQSNLNIDNNVTSKSNSGSYAATSGNGTSYSQAGTATHAASYSRASGMACPKSANGLTNTITDANGSSYGRNHSSGSGVGEAVANMYVSSEADASVEATFSGKTWHPRLNMQWGGDIDLNSSSEVGVSSTVYSGTNEDGLSGGAGSSANQMSGNVAINVTPLSISDVKEIYSNGTNSMSVYSAGHGAASGGAIENSDGSVDAWASVINNRRYD